jgi:hypothetical protein
MYWDILEQLRYCWILKKQWSQLVSGHLYSGRDYKRSCRDVIQDPVAALMWRGFINEVVVTSFKILLQH